MLQIAPMRVDSKIGESSLRVSNSNKMKNGCSADLKFLFLIMVSQLVLLSLAGCATTREPLQKARETFTHKISPAVDEAREYLVENMVISNTLDIQKQTSRKLNLSADAGAAKKWISPYSRKFPKTYPGSL